MRFNDINLQVSGPQQPASTYKTKVLKGQVPFATQVTEPNTKYVIKHNFDLGGGSVTIPENCLLEFDGGAISNGTLVGQSTILIYNQPLNDILTATLEGTWRHESGVKADEEDITDINGELKLKDREPASETNPNGGMGRIILRKNMVDSVNTLTQSMMQATNTIYAIRYDYNISGDNVNINANLNRDRVKIIGDYRYYYSEPVNLNLSGKKALITQPYCVLNTALTKVYQDKETFDDDSVCVALWERNDVYYTITNANGKTSYTKTFGIDKYRIDNSWCFVTDLVELAEGDTIKLGKEFILVNSDCTASINTTTSNNSILYTAVSDVQIRIGYYVVAYNAVSCTFTNRCIEIPANCVLEFNGGSINNGVICGNGTNIKADLVKIFGIEASIGGTWNVERAYPVQFGALGNGVQNDTNAFVNALAVSNYVYTPIGNYIIDGAGYEGTLEQNESYYSGIWIYRSNVTMEFEDGAILNKIGTATRKRNGLIIAPRMRGSATPVTWMDIYNIHIIGGEIVGNRKDYPANTLEENSTGILSSYAHNVLVENCYIHEFQGDGIGAENGTDIRWQNILSEKNVRTGFAIYNVDSLYMNNCKSIADGTNITYSGVVSNAKSPASSLTIETDARLDIPANNIHIENCYFDATDNICAASIGKGFHGNGKIYIENNTFIKNDNRMIFDIETAAKGVDELHIKNNNIKLQSDSNSYIDTNTFLYIVSYNGNLLNVVGNKLEGNCNFATFIYTVSSNVIKHINIVGNTHLSPKSFIIQSGPLINVEHLKIDSNICYCPSFWSPKGNIGLPNINNIVEITNNSIFNLIFNGTEMAIFGFSNIKQGIYIIKNNYICASDKTEANLRVYLFYIPASYTADDITKNIEFIGNRVEFLTIRSSPNADSKFINKDFYLFSAIIKGNIFISKQNINSPLPDYTMTQPLIISDNVFIGSSTPLTSSDRADVIKSGNVTTGTTV